MQKKLGSEVFVSTRGRIAIGNIPGVFVSFRLGPAGLICERRLRLNWTLKGWFASSERSLDRYRSVKQ